MITKLILTESAREPGLIQVRYEGTQEAFGSTWRGGGLLYEIYKMEGDVFVVLGAMERRPHKVLLGKEAMTEFIASFQCEVVKQPKGGRRSRANPL